MKNCIKIIVYLHNWVLGHPYLELYLGRKEGSSGHTRFLILVIMLFMGMLGTQVCSICEYTELCVFLISAFVRMHIRLLFLFA